MEYEATRSSSNPARAGFSAWLKSVTGGILVSYEREKIAGILSDQIGYHITQIGHFDGGMLESAGRIRNKIELHLEEDGLQDRASGVLANAVSLPFAAHSIDVVVIPHVLEFTPEPGTALTEIERVLIDDGLLVIAGFNPWSLWGLWRWHPLLRRRPPWNGRFHGTARLKQWLSVLDFELLEVDRFLFRPPFGQSSSMKRWLFLEKLGKLCWPYFGAAYIMLARKRRIPVTPVKINWRKKTFLSGASAGPATMTEADKLHPDATREQVY